MACRHRLRTGRHRPRGTRLRRSAALGRQPQAPGTGGGAGDRTAVVPVSAWRVATTDAGLRVLACLAAAEALLALLVNPGGNLPAPLGGAAVTWPLLSCLAPLGLVGVWTHPMAILERTSVRGPWSPALLRLAAATPLVLTATLAVALAAPPDSSPVAGDGFAPWRNAALVSGLPLAGAARPPRPLPLPPL